MVTRLRPMMTFGAAHEFLKTRSDTSTSVRVRNAGVIGRSRIGIPTSVTLLSMRPLFHVRTLRSHMDTYGIVAKTGFRNIDCRNPRCISQCVFIPLTFVSQEVQGTVRVPRGPERGGEIDGRLAALVFFPTHPHLGGFSKPNGRIQIRPLNFGFLYYRNQS